MQAHVCMRARVYACVCVHECTYRASVRLSVYAHVYASACVPVPVCLSIKYAITKRSYASISQPGEGLNEILYWCQLPPSN